VAVECQPEQVPDLRAADDLDRADERRELHPGGL